MDEQNLDGLDIDYAALQPRHLHVGFTVSQCADEYDLLHSFTATVTYWSEWGPSTR